MSTIENTLASVFKTIIEMKWWDRFEQLEYSNELLMIFGTLVVIFGLMKIIRSGFKMLFWVFLCCAGLGAIAYGRNNSEVDLPFNNSNELSEYVGSGKELSADVMQLLCDKFDKSQIEGL